jgi:hypothetical protein
VVDAGTCEVRTCFSQTFKVCSAQIVCN